jgi:prephenate dehydrogenase
MDLLVVGAGGMGRWLARTLAPDDVAFVDVDPNRAAAAAAAVPAGRAVEGDFDETFDVVALAVPMDAVADAAAAHADRAREAVIDVTGTMAPAIAALRDAAPDRERLSLHPLFAPDRGTGRIAAVPDQSGPTTAAIRERLDAAGNQVFETTAQAHDEAMETVQSRAHAAILAFALAAEDVDPAFHTPVSAELARLANRLTTGDPSTYADIQGAFDGAGDVAAAARRIADADPDAIGDLVAAADELNVPAEAAEGSDDDIDAHDRESGE